MPKFSGRCLCGDVEYSGDAAPVFAANCHCTDCRRVSGAGHVSLFGVPATAIDVRGETRGFNLAADSGSEVTHHFCPNCGVRVFNTNTATPDIVAVMATTLDDPEFFKPMATVFASRALPWDPPNPDTQHFSEMPPH